LRAVAGRGIMGHAPAESYVRRNALRRRSDRHLGHCTDYRCSHSTAISADRWPDHVRLSDIEPGFVCTVCGKRGTDVRPDFHWHAKPVGGMGYRRVAVMGSG
jgi:hypothetical protein